MEPVEPWPAPEPVEPWPVQEAEVEEQIPPPPVAPPTQERELLQPGTPPAGGSRRELGADDSAGRPVGTSSKTWVLDGRRGDRGGRAAGPNAAGTAW